jgi:hypothetical protein
MTDFESPARINLLMCDHPDLHISKTYFNIFQLLRTFSSMIRETHNDFRDWHFKVLATFRNRHEEERLQAENPILKRKIQELCKQ